MNKELNNIKYNTRRSKGVMMARFMRDPMVLQARIIAIQEPWANPYQETTHHLAKQSHQLLYPQANQTGGLRTRSTPWARYSSWANHSFTPECRETIKVIRQLRRRARNRKGRVIAKACCTAYRKWVKEITEEGTKGMWKIGKWARNREASSGSIILALKRPDGNLSDTS
ncbi:hypothetical protein N7448_008958 [Penicillium atrosanguineum]|uniref:Uncharacterized protein n=1 Tax=Penicillium atrosanguineum TaxID=1132637 RepID=A0A9W9KZJ2_9EURO|nr:hypothetical protein N7448_008958 [Penicillium atrosanguineum]KAJ5330236.1 hypothetical protein N7476_000019 [Penicillium atrosanguineum]